MKFFLIGIIFCILLKVSAQSDTQIFDFASKNNREKVKQELIQKINTAIEYNFSQQMVIQ